MADGGEDGVGGVAGAALEIAAAEMALGLHVADHGLDGGAASQFALDGAEDAALLAGDEDAARVGRIVAAVSLVDIGALDLAAGELLGVLDDGPQCVAVIGIARQRLGVQHELAARRAGIGGDDRDLDAELVGRAGLALADAFDLGGVEGIELPAALALLLGADLDWRARAARSNAASMSAWPAILRRMSRISRPSRVRKKRNSRWWRLNCLAWA